MTENTRYTDNGLGLITLRETLWKGPGPDGEIYADGDVPNGSQLIGVPGSVLTYKQAEACGLLKASAPAEDKALPAPGNKAISTEAIKPPATRVR